MAAHQVYMHGLPFMFHSNSLRQGPAQRPTSATLFKWESLSRTSPNSWWNPKKTITQKKKLNYLVRFNVIIFFGSFASSSSRHFRLVSHKLKLYLFFRRYSNSLTIHSIFTRVVRRYTRHTLRHNFSIFNLHLYSWLLCNRNCYCYHLCSNISTQAEENETELGKVWSPVE